MLQNHKGILSYGNYPILYRVSIGFLFVKMEQGVPELQWGSAAEIARRLNL